MDYAEDFPQDPARTLKLPVPRFPELTHDPDLEITQKVVIPTGPGIPEYPVLPPHLIRDPILGMEEPQEHATTMFEHYYGPRPKLVPPRPHRGPRMPLTRRDHALAALAASVVVLGSAAFVVVQTGWDAQMPESRQTQLPAVPGTPGNSPLPRTPAPVPSTPLQEVGSASPAHIPAPVSPASPSASPSPSAGIRGPVSSPSPTSAPTTPQEPSGPTGGPTQPSQPTGPSQPSSTPTDIPTDIPTVPVPPSTGTPLVPLPPVVVIIHLPLLLQ
jgi:hypothetical protein